MNIFITVGTTNFPFNRMDHLVKKISKTNPQAKILYQSRTSLAKPLKNLEIISELSFDKYIKAFKQCDLCITHGGPATIWLALKYCRYIPYVIPRKRKYKEHVDDHQIIFYKFMEKKGIIRNLELKKVSNIDQLSLIKNVKLNSNDKVKIITFLNQYMTLI